MCIFYLRVSGVDDICGFTLQTAAVNSSVVSVRFVTCTRSLEYLSALIEKWLGLLCGEGPRPQLG